MAGSPKKRARRQAAVANSKGAERDVAVEEAGEPETDVQDVTFGASPAKAGKDAREHLKLTADENIELLAQQLIKNAAATKRYKAHCPHCDRNIIIEIPDSKASNDAIDKLMAMGYGRKTADTSKHEGFILERRIIRPSEEETLESALRPSVHPGESAEPVAGNVG